MSETLPKYPVQPADLNADRRTGKVKKQKKPNKLTVFLNRFDILMHIPLSLGTVFVLEWLSHHSFTAACDFATQHTGAFLYNAFLVFVCFTPVFLVKRRTFLRMFIAAIFVMLGIVNCIILLNRVSPFGFTDINMVGDLLTMQNTNYFSAEQGAISLIAIAMYAVYLVHLFRKGAKKEAKFPFWLRLTLVILCFVSVPPVTEYLQKKDVISSYFGNLAQGYKDNGYLYGFASSVFDRGMSQPDNYDQAHIDKILKKTDMGQSTIYPDAMPNIVVVLLESFYDVDECKFLECSEDPIPYFHELEQNYSTGHFIAPVVGAGTCNTEFEILTGMSVQFFGPGEYPQKTVLKQIDRCESVADILKPLGYGTHVVHNNGGNFYSRRNAFTLMGFDSFQSKEMLDITEYTPLGSWPTDDILIGASEDALNTTEGPDFLYTITVETHGDYPKTKIIENPAIRVTAKNKDEATENQWEYFVNMLHSEDEFIRDYIKMFEERGEDTLVIMFGDHLPTMGLAEDEVSTHNLYLTKYVTWNNFGMSKEDMDLTAYQLVPEFLNRLGIHGGTMINYNQYKTAKGVDPKSDAYMDDLEVLQYDLLYGKRLAYHDEDLYPASDMEMGVNDVVIKNIYLYDGKLHIYGDNFTKWSKVFVGEERVTTTYESGQVLTISADDVENGDRITVAQVGSSSTIFRMSNSRIFYNANLDAEQAALASGAEGDEDGVGVESGTGALD